MLDAVPLILTFMTPEGSTSLLSSEARHSRASGWSERLHTLVLLPSGGRGTLVLILLAAAGVAISAVVFVLFRGKDEAAIRAGFHRRADRQRAIVTMNLRQHVDSLHVLEILFRFSDWVDRREFQSASGELLKRFSGVHAFEWAPIVTAEERSAVEEIARKEGATDFEFRDRTPEGKFVRAPERPLYCPILYVYPLEGNEMVLGYELTKGPSYQIIEKARDSGKILGTQPIILAQEKEGSLGWVLICPVYDEGVDTQTVEGRRAHLRGFLQGVFRMPDMFANAWRDLHEMGVQSMVLDVTPGSSYRVLHQEGLTSKTGGGRPVSEGEMRSGLHVEHLIEVAGRQWALLIRPAPDWVEQQRSHYPVLIGLCGLVITGLLSASAQGVRNRGRAVRQLVAQGTAELAASRDSLQVALQSAQAAEEEVHRRLGSERDARVQAENAEHVAEEAVMLLDTIFRTAPVGLAFLDSELRFAKVNESLAAINGVPMEDHLGRTVEEVNPRVARQAAAHHRSVLETGQPVVNFMLSDREGHWIASYYPVKKPQGPVVGVGIVVVDITELKEAEEKAQRLAAAVEQSTEVTLILDPEGRVVYANRVYYRLSGLAPADVFGTHIDQMARLLPPEHAFSTIVGQIEKEGAWSSRVNATGSDARQLTLDVSISPVRTDQGVVTNYVLVGHDVSREVLLEERLRTSQKMEAVGLLAGGIAHDFNNLLQVIEGYTALSLDLPCSAEELPHNLQQVREAASRAAQLTKQLLLFSRRQPLARTEVDLHELSVNMLKMIHRLIGPQIEVVFTAPPCLWAVQADRGQLEQVVLNLCLNARDAMPGGGRLQIELQDVQLDTVQASEIADLAPGRFVQLRVEDTGSGISLETQKRIFEPFFTTKPGGHGTGLGLSVVYGIVQQHEGAIVINSAPGRGTAFEVYLPALGKVASAVPTEVLRAPVRGNETVLVVEDEAPVRNLTALVLQQSGYNVIEAVDGQNACEIFAERKDEIDLVLMDVMMPRMGGIEAWNRIQEMRPVPILFCSGYTGGPGYLPRGAPLLPKPFKAEQLLMEIRKLLNVQSSERRTV